MKLKTFEEYSYNENQETNEGRKKNDWYYKPSDSDVANANSEKRKFLKKYPDAKVSISTTKGFVYVNGVIAYDISSMVGNRKTEDCQEKLEKAYKKSKKEDLNESVDKFQDELEKELAWVKKYSKYIDKGTYPKGDYDDEDEFYDDLEKTEDNIERLKLKIKKGKAVKESLNEGVKEDFLNLKKGDVIKCTKFIQLSEETNTSKGETIYKTPKKTNTANMFEAGEEYRLLAEPKLSDNGKIKIRTMNVKHGNGWANITATPRVLSSHFEIK